MKNNLIDKYFPQGIETKFCEENGAIVIFIPFPGKQEEKPIKEEETPLRGEKIKGIRGLAKYLGCSVSKAQDMKNKGLLPYYNVGKLVHFFSGEVDNALKGR
ncbi:MAG: DUF3853 family protein [Bacteroidales bacterium]|nr:DUF3853 family protein [Bacteroidales bacterium]